MEAVDCGHEALPRTNCPWGGGACWCCPSCYELCVEKWKEEQKKARALKGATR